MAVVKAGLRKRNLITDPNGPQFRTWYTHGICHWIGMDVHDVGDYRRPLEAGIQHAGVEWADGTWDATPRLTPLGDDLLVEFDVHRAD